MHLRGTIIAASVATIAAFLLVARPAWAYRPFDGTDADVAAHGEFELELAPIGYLYTQDASSLVLPAVVLNYGFAKGFELVVDARHQLSLGPLHGRERSRLLDTDVLVKAVLREGSLQNEPDDPHSGISVATELGPLLPEFHGDAGLGVGFGVNLIASQRWDNLTLHLNSMPAIDRDHRVDWFESLIIEGPDRWTVRPVAELSVEKEWFGPFTASALGGTIIRVSEAFYLDAAGRAFSIDGDVGYEARLGFTWGVPIFEPTVEKQRAPEGEPKEKTL